MKYIVFDFDGTLADSRNVFIQAWNVYASVYHYDPITQAEVDATKHLSLHQRAKKFHFPMHKLPIIMPKVYRYFKEHIKEVKLYPGIKVMLQSLAQEGYEIFILSSNEKENIKLLLQQEQIDSVKDILTSSKIFGKDSVLKRLVKQYQLKASELLYVGDELRDIQACNKVNVPFMWVSWGIDGFDLIKKENPEFVVHTPEEIVRKLITVPLHK
ncbi:phosphoglycolate phosphatase [Lysinibacillus sp. PLM2]|nr:phosphoglycolate phosphatase [Lysinibacillus sp. PLM2]